MLLAIPYFVLIPPLKKIQPPLNLCGKDTFKPRIHLLLRNIPAKRQTRVTARLSHNSATVTLLAWVCELWNTARYMHPDMRCFQRIKHTLKIKHTLLPSEQHLMFSCKTLCFPFLSQIYVHAPHSNLISRILQGAPTYAQRRSPPLRHRNKSSLLYLMLP